MKEWGFCLAYLEFMKPEAPQRLYSMRVMFNAVHYVVHAGCPWRMLPNDLPPWETISQQAQRWIKAGCFEAMVHDLRMLLRVCLDKKEQLTAVILDGCTLQSTPESGARAAYDGYKRRKTPRCTSPWTHWVTSWL